MFYTNSTSQFGHVNSSYRTEDTALEDWVATAMNPTFYKTFKESKVNTCRRHPEVESITVS